MTPIFAVEPSYAIRLGAAFCLAGFADFLFFDQPAGISLLLFALVLGAAVIALHPHAVRASKLPLKVGGLAVALLPLVENVSSLSFLIALVGMVMLALSVAERLRRGVARAARQLTMFLLAAPFRLMRDFFRWRKVARRSGAKALQLAAIAVWAMPLTLGAVFLVLFGAANPVIEYWLSLIDFWKFLEFIQPARILFWLLVLIGVWAFLRPRLPRFFNRPPRKAPSLADGRPAPVRKLPAIEDVIFGRDAILRALIVFNLMFAVQTVLDAIYLWGGAALPDGLTLAAYAHRGAYPLIATALLAAGFVLAAMRPGGATSGDPLIRALVYAWVAQNIALVVSSIFRLDLYVSFYSLTYWRVAAFVWMGLVVAGLALIIARIALGKSNEWLLSANLLTLSATLYACGFINFAALIASYNVGHSLEMGGGGVNLDTCYLRTLGPGAFPAIDRLLDGPSQAALNAVREWRYDDEASYRVLQENWRAWSFRDWRLLGYLDDRAQRSAPTAPTALSPDL